MKQDSDLLPFSESLTRLTEFRLISAELYPLMIVSRLPSDALENINGPSVVRMLEWAEGKKAALQLFFGHHKGDFIRLGYADRLEGQ